MTQQRIDCEEVLRHLLEYLDHDLDEADAAAIGHHLEHCRACFSRAEFEKKVKQAVRAAGIRRASKRLRSRIKDIIGQF